MSENLGADTPYPLSEVLRILADAADHLLGEHGCDAHGYEIVSAARDAARLLLLQVSGETEQASVRDDAAEPLVPPAPSGSPASPEAAGGARLGTMWIVFILRDGGQAETTFASFNDEAEARRFYDTASAQWSDAFLCRVERGPGTEER